MKLKSFVWGTIFVSSVFFGLPYGAAKLNTRLSFPTYTPFKILGGILAIIGILIVRHCVFLFKKLGKGTPVPIEPPKTFIAKGLYRYMRNPMMLGMFTVILSYFFLFGHVLILAYLALMMLTVHLIIVFWEEPDLKKRFGKSYMEYRRNVRRWIPQLKPFTAKN